MIKIKYKLKDIEKQEAVRKLTGYDFDFFNNKSTSPTEHAYYPVETGTTCYDILNSLGLIDLWFEEVPFKVGDYVVLTSNINDQLTYYSNDADVPVGKPLKVSRIESTEKNFGYWVVVEGTSLGISKNQFRRATEKEIHDYKSGRNLPTIGGYRPKNNYQDISYGCVSINRESLRQVLNAADILRMDILADGEIITITEHELKQIKDFLNKGE